ncbi:uncharacterized protein METZ01_LOCUS376499 [marine metagenome]|uniref:Uncharacterized protein n=1 Tax=marine metagenome TaxID=408172 RepID=A0A382TPF0_9ZZZZ
MQDFHYGGPIANQNHERSSRRQRDLSTWEE